MTTLTITPDIAKKRMKLAGRIAAGEKVAVTVKGFGSRPTATTRLRVLFAHNIIAQFPLPPAEGEQIVGWTVSGEDLTAVLNLNTVQAEKFTRVHAVNCLFILDDVSDGVRQLYATEDMEILRWIKTPDTDVPVNLDDFPKMLEEVRAEINNFKSEMANRANEYETSLSSAWNTYRNSLNVSIQQFTNTVMSAVNNKADAQTVNSHVQRSDNPHNVTKSQVGLGNVDNTSDMSKPVSNLQKQAIETAVSEVRRAVDSEANRADGRERAIANSVDAERRRASTEEEKLDLAIRTEKEERDGDVAALRALIAAVDGMKRVIADSLPDPGEEYADKIYMIPSSNPGERNVKDEFMCFYTSSEGWQWEQIGSTAIDLDAKQDKLYTQGGQSVWSFSTESTGSKIEAFMAASGNYSVSESEVGGGWMYSVTGYDTSVYYVATVVRTQKSTNIDFYVFDQTETELYGQIRATYAAVPTNIPAQVDTTPVHDSGRLVISGGIWSMIWGALTALPAGISSLYDWCVAQLALKYAKPADGIPKTDLSESVQTSLGKADTALQTAPVTSVNNKTGAVTLSASDVGALGNTGDQILRGRLIIDSGGPDGDVWLQTKRGEQNGLALALGGFVIDGHFLELPYASGTLALLADIYAAIQQIAPAFAAKAYVLNELCTYNGVVYRCKSAYTAEIYNPKPDRDTTHWEAKKVSELFLPLTGGTMTGDIIFDGGRILTDPSGLRIFDSSDHYWAFYEDRENTVARLGDIVRLAPLASPAFTGTPTAPTPTADDNSTRVATTAFVKTAVEGVTPNLDYVMRVDPETGGIYYTTPDTNA